MLRISITTNQEAFTPTIGAQAGAGLYNSSTLELLSAEAQARSVAQASAAVLNYQTTQQQLAQQAASTLISDTRSTTTTGANNQVKTTAPLVSGSSLLQLGGGIAASIAGKAIYNSDLVQNNIVAPIKECG